MTMLRRRAMVAMAAALALGTAASACGSKSSNSANSGANATPTHLVFAAVPSENNQDMRNDYRNVIADLEKDLGVTIDFKTTTDYAGVVAGVKSGTIDLASFGPLSYVIAKNQGADIEPVAAEISTKGAQPGYFSYGITQGKNSAVRSIADFKGKKVCLVDPQSTSGYLYPLAGLKKVGIDAAKDITSTYAGAHDRSVLSVVNGSCDVGFAEDLFVDKALISKGLIKAGDVKVVWKSPEIPGSPIAVRSNLSPAFKAKLRAEFAKFDVDYWVQKGQCTAGDVSCGPDGGIYGYAPVTDSFFDVIRQVCDQTKAPSCSKF